MPAVEANASSRKATVAMVPYHWPVFGKFFAELGPRIEKLRSATILPHVRAHMELLPHPCRLPGGEAPRS